MRHCAYIALTMLLAGCATASESIIRTVEVKVPVTVACVPSALAGPPVYPDTAETLRAAPGAAERYQMLAAGRELRIQRLSELEPVIAACR